VEPHRLRIGSTQHGALTIYVFDPAVNVVLFDDDALFPGSLEDGALVVNKGGEDVACRLLGDASNSADADGDDEMARALIVLVRRVRKACKVEASG
jgi:hypothetical protein